MARRKQKATKRENGLGTVTQQPNGTYRWRATAGHRLDGRPLRVTGTAATREAAQAAITAVRAQAAKGSVSEPTRVTVSAHLAMWLAHKAPELAPKSLHNYTRVIALHINPHLGRIRLQRLAPAHIQAMFNALASLGLGDTQRQVRNVLYAALEHARLLRLINDNPAKDIRTTQTKQKAPRAVKALTAEEVSMLLPVLRQSRWGLPFEFMLHTGLRRAEVCGLRWADVDLDKGTVHVRTNRVVVGGRPQDGPTKTARSNRLLTLSEEGRDCLRRQQVSQALERDALAPGPVKGHAKAVQRQRTWQDSGRVFTQICGSELHPDTLLKYLRRFCEQAGIRPATNHMMRHTYASLMLRGGVPLEVVSRMVGHERPSFTADVYRTVYEDETTRWALNLSDLAGTQAGRTQPA